MTDEIDKKYVYDKEYFSSLRRTEKEAFTKKFINDLVSRIHNPQLVKKEQSPLGNPIYHLHSDGRINWGKGGWAYGNRSRFEIKSYCVKPSTFFEFPLKNVGSEVDTYAILTEEECFKVRDLMDVMLLNV